MTIAKGQAWGEPAVLPADAVITRTDREISRALDEARRTASPYPTFGILGGDLGHTLGAKNDIDRLRAGATAFPVDLGEVLVDGRHRFFAAHVVAHNRGWRHFAVVMNAQWVGGWNFGPKAHPNDGVLDGYEGQLDLFEWRKVRARLPSGTHLPHPRIRPTRAVAVTFEFAKPLLVYIDGEEIGPARHLAARAIPDAIRVVA
ncbi:MAG: hypothetical protein H0U92_07810 [Actinobacteria bacterium]|nr:hypothetical protein [Actinomycetota bacterium]